MSCLLHLLSHDICLPCVVATYVCHAHNSLTTRLLAFGNALQDYCSDYAQSSLEPQNAIHYLTQAVQVGHWRCGMMRLFVCKWSRHQTTTS